MIKLFTCLLCEHCEKLSCPAYPEGIPDEVLMNKKRDEQECGNGVKYQGITNNY